MKAPDFLCRSRGRDRAGGFLLTETLATFTISAFVLLGLVSASSVMLRNVDQSVAHVQDVDDLSRTMSAIERDVSGLARARWYGFEPQPFVFRGGPNSLFFAHTQREPDGFGETRVIALREIIAGNVTKLTRGEAQLSALATGFDALHFAPQRELGTGPARLRFYYLPAVAGKVGPRLLAWPEGPLLPAAIVVEAVERNTGRLIVSKHVAIHANADIGCLSGDKAEGSAVSAISPNGSTPGAVVAPTSSPIPSAGLVGAQADETQKSFCGRAGSDKDKNGRRDAEGRPIQPQQSQPGPTL